MNDSFIFYHSFAKGIKRLSPDQQLKAFWAIVNYAVDGIEPPDEDEDELYVGVFEMAQPQIDSNMQKRKDGQKGGRPKKTSGSENEKPVVSKNEENKKPNVNVNVNVNDNVNANENVNDNANANVNVNVNANGNENKNILADARDLFERLWRLYPCKKGKGQVSDTQKKRLLAIGEAELVKAIERYSSELQKDAGWRKPQNGSTFFNSGYVDYLDDNFVPSEDKPKSTGSAYIDAIKNRLDVVDEWYAQYAEEDEDG